MKFGDSVNENAKEEDAVTESIFMDINPAT